MRVLMVTPTLGQSRWLTFTVDSVKACAPGARHVLVAPAAHVATLRTRFPSVDVIREPQGVGMYGAINSAAATGEWDAVGYINDDDILMSGFSAVVREARKQAEMSAVVYGRVKLIDAAGRRLGAIPVSPAPALNRALYAQRLEPVYQHGTLFTRKAWDALGGFDPSLRFCGDSDLLARACLAGISFSRVAGEVAAFRLRSGQLTKNRAAMIAERSYVDTKLGLVATSCDWKQRWARLRFRVANLPAYAERVARHGPITFDELLVRSG